MRAQHQVTRRQFLRAAGLTALGASLAACAAPPAAPAASEGGVASPTEAPVTTGGETVTLNFVCDTINEGHQKVRDEWAKAFTEKNPNIIVNHQPVPGSDYNTKIQTLFAAGTPPDVYRYLQEVTPIVTVAEKNLHLELDPFIAKDKYDTSDFRPSALALYKWNGKTYALPRDYGHQNLFLNLDLLSKEGLTPPTADWTDTGFKFETFLDLAQKLTKKEGDRTVQWGFLVNRGWRPWASWVYNNGATVVNKNDQGIATEISLTDPNAVEAMQFLQDLMYKHGVAPRPDIESEMGGFELFASGRVGMMINNPSSVNQYRTITAFKWDVATLPLGKAETRGTGGGGTGWASAAGTKYPDQAWEFLKHISSTEAELDEVGVGATTPSRISVVESKEFLDTSKGPANIAAFAQAQEYVVRDPVHVRWPEVFQRVVVSNMDTLWSGKNTAQEVADAIKAEGDKLFVA
jgi:multiple sugar transport system substrate-binding protein